MKTTITRFIYILSLTNFRFAGAFMAMLLISSIAYGTDVSREDKMKAAYVLILSKYVTWPSLLDSSQIQVCIVDDVDMYKAADTIVGKTLHGKIVQTRNLTNTEIEDCNIIFFGGKNFTTSSNILAKTNGSAILTMADSAGFAANGGVIELVVVNNTIKFEINSGAAESNGLSLNQHLVGLATRVFK